MPNFKTLIVKAIKYLIPVAWFTVQLLAVLLCPRPVVIV